MVPLLSSMEANRASCTSLSCPMNRPSTYFMCIGLDVRGNVNFSPKATLPRPGSKTNTSIATPQAPRVREPIENEHEKTYQDSKPLDSGTSSISGSSEVLIGSAVECDEDEKSASPNKKSKRSLRSYSESKSNAKSPVENNANSVSDDEDEINTDSRGVLNSNKSTSKAPLSVKKLKLGTKMTAKVYQVRARGLFLDLGGGIRGMYQFEAGFRRDFEVGEEVKVKCSSFSTKGIPVMSLVEEHKS